jgi:hypothetical protein
MLRSVKSTVRHPHCGTSIVANRKPEPLRVSDFSFVFTKNWTPVKLDDKTTPQLLRGIPPDKVYGIYASGQAPENPELLTAARVRVEFITVGGIDVFRRAEARDGVRFNKDHYEVVVDPDDHQHLGIVGPLKDADHWSDDLPSHLRHFEVEKTSDRKSGRLMRALKVAARVIHRLRTLFSARRS